MAEQDLLDYVPVTFNLGTSNLERNTRFVGNQTWLNGPLTLIGPRGEIQGPGGAYLRSTGTEPSNAQIELRLTGAVDDSKIQLTESTLTLEGGTAVELTANDSGTIRLNSVTHINTTGQFATPSSTNAALTIGTYDTGDYKVRIGTRSIQASEGDLTSDLNLNRSGGAILGRTFQVAPFRNIGTVMAGSGASVTSATQEFAFQAGKTTVTFSAGAGTLTFPTAFPNGLIGFAANALAAGDVTLTWSAAAAGTVTLFCAVAGAARTGNTDVSWIAIGW